MSTGIATALVDLLGETRAQVVELVRQRPQGVAELAAQLGMSEAGVRKHLAVLEADGFLSAETVRRDGPGRPASRYALTAKARRLYPDQSAAFASDLMDYLEAEHGRKALLGFLRWRQERQTTRVGERLAGAESTQERAERLAAVLTDEGFMAGVETVTAPDGATVLELTQTHCAIAEVAHEHPELCAYEAALFQRVLGAPVSRRQTIAGGANACVCVIKPPAAADSVDTGAPHGH